MVPPVGAIIIGPCPQCNDLVVVFCGHVLALDKAIMENGETQDRREHLLGVLTEFLQSRIARLLSDEADFQESEFDGDGLPEGELIAQTSESDVNAPRQSQDNPISQTELERFTDVDLKLLDNKAYFKSVFDAN